MPSSLRIQKPRLGAPLTGGRSHHARQELNIGEAVQRAMDAVNAEDWKVAGEAVLTANMFDEMRETMADNDYNDAAEFAAKAAMEKREHIIP
jgi:hypothetical protein